MIPRMTEPGRARGVAHVVALTLAALLLPLGMLSSWSSAILSDNNRYVDAVAPLADDPVVKKAVVDHLTDQALTMFDPNRSAGPCGTTAAASGSSGGPGGLGDIANALMPLAETPIRAIVSGIVDSPAFATAWVGANRSAHDQLIDVLQGDDRLVDSSGCVSIDLGSVLREAVPQMQGLSGFIPVPSGRTPVASIAAGRLHTARVAYSALNPLGFWLPILWLLAVAVAFASGRRRRRTLWILGATSAVGLVVLLVGLSAVRSSVAGASGDPAVTRAIWDAVASSIRHGAVVGLVLSVVAAAAGGWLDRPAVEPSSEPG
ncbi:MAG: hypothetical protein JWP74_4091 [Marmoricola sp.]|nr:hypothetical protein [Marmoricola sp.]